MIKAEFTINYYFFKFILFFRDVLSSVTLVLELNAFNITSNVFPLCFSSLHYYVSINNNSFHFEDFNLHFCKNDLLMSRTKVITFYWPKILNIWFSFELGLMKIVN